MCFSIGFDSPYLPFNRHPWSVIWQGTEWTNSLLIYENLIINS